MSAKGIAAQALAAEIVSALLADEKDGGYDLTAGLFGASFSALVRRWAELELERASPPPEVDTVHALAGSRHAPNSRLLELADRIDHEQFWRLSGIEQGDMSPEKKDRVIAGVMLRRYADLLGSGCWRIYPPRPGISYRADSLDAVVEMARNAEAKS